MVKEHIINFWNQVKLLGTGENSEENDTISLMNKMGILGGSACIVMFFISTTTGSSIIYSIMALFLGLTLLLTLVLNKFNKTHISKLVVTLFIPALVCLYIAISGGAFGENSILIVSIFIIYTYYKNEPKTMTKLYLAGGFFYLCAQLRVFFFPPLFTVGDNPYDEFVAFVVCVIWLLMIISLYQKQIVRQKEEQEKLISELQEKNGSLIKTTEELEQFTYIASHDLKSPLRTIISFLDLIKRDVTRERYDDLLSKLDFARSGAEQMNYLVTDILEYSKITSGTKRKKKVIDLQTIADKVRFNLTDILEKKKVDLYVFPLPKFYGNETEMTVIFQNFIENGVKYNEENTPNIFVKSNIENDRLILQFIDNGIGIEEQYFEKIFLFFKRLHTNEHYKGTGLGLGLCKKIIDDMDGTVSVESTMNVGSTFTVSLPIDQEHLIVQDEVLSAEYS